MFFLFLIIPLLEMYLLIEVGSHIGSLTTVGLVILTAMVGLALLRRQGLLTFSKAMRRFNQGELPMQELAEGLLLGIAGALLVTPGFLTDGIGFFLLSPLGRISVARLIVPMVKKPETQFSPDGKPAPRYPHPAQRSRLKPY